MLLNYVDYLNNLRDSISVSFGNTGELLEAYKLTALLLLNYAIMILVGLLICWAVCKFISVVTFYAIKLGMKFNGVYSNDDEIADKFFLRALGVFIVAESIILLSYWFLSPTQLFMFPNMNIIAAQFNSMLIVFFTGAYALYAIRVNWYIATEAGVIKASVKPLTDIVYKSTNSVSSKYNLFYESARKFELYIREDDKIELIDWALEEKISREEFEKRLIEKMLDDANRWKHFDIDILMTRGRCKKLRRLCS